MPDPTVACIMLTANRPEMAKQAVEAFRAQTYARKRLVIVDTSESVDYDLKIADSTSPMICYAHAPQHRGRTIGELRNVANDSTDREWADILCHFDDDDFSHARARRPMLAAWEQYRLWPHDTEERVERTEHRNHAPDRESGHTDMTVAIYARVSTNDKGQDTENQLRELREFAAVSGFTIYKEYIDQETASGKRTRPQFDQMFTDASRLRFKAVLCWALDRLSREGIGPTFRYIEKLKEYGVDFISFREPHFRTTGEAGSLMLAMAAWLAEQERKRLGDRTRAGMATARLKGKRLGRPVVVIDIARVRQLKAEGKGVIKIAAALTADGCKVSRETVRRLLTAS